MNFEVVDKKDYLHLQIEMPGIKISDLDLEVRGRQLVVKTQKGKRQYFQVIPLAVEVETAGAKIDYELGVLKLRLPKLKKVVKKIKLQNEKPFWEKLWGTWLWT